MEIQSYLPLTLELSGTRQRVRLDDLLARSSDAPVRCVRLDPLAVTTDLPCFRIRHEVAQLDMNSLCVFPRGANVPKFENHNVTSNAACCDRGAELYDCG